MVETLEKQISSQKQGAGKKPAAVMPTIEIVGNDVAVTPAARSEEEADQAFVVGVEKEQQRKARETSAEKRARAQTEELQRQVYRALNEIFNVRQSKGSLLSAFQRKTDAEKKPYAADYHVGAIAENYPKMEKKKGEVLFHNDTSVISVTGKKIQIELKPAEDGEEPSFTEQQAYSMAMIASKNPDMVKKGIKLTGTEEQQALLRWAIERVNLELPVEQRLRIRGDNEPAIKLEEAHADTVPQWTPEEIDAQVKADLEAQGIAQPIETSKTMENELVAGTASDIDEPSQKASVIRAAADTAMQGQPRGLFERLARRAALGEKVEDILVPAAAPVKKAASDKDAEMSDDAAGATASGVAPVVAKEKTALNRRALLVGGLAAGTLLALPTEKAEARGFFHKLLSGRWHDEPEAGHVPVPQHKPHHAVSGKHRTHKHAPHKNTGHKSTHKHAHPAKHKHDVHAGKGKPQTAKNALSKQQQQAADVPVQRGWFGLGSSKTGGVWIQNTHNSERMYLDFCALGSCSSKFNSFARDWRKNKAISMDQRLLRNVELVVGELRRMGYPATQVNLVSGYRTPETNRMLQGEGIRKHGSSGVASSSFHMRGMAMDFTVSGVSTKVLHSVTCKMIASTGGVGYYPVSAFVHMDTRGAGARWAGA